MGNPGYYAGWYGLREADQIKIITQPCPSGKLNKTGHCVGQAATSRDVYTYFETQPKVQVSNAIGNPVESRRVQAMFVKAETTKLSFNDFFQLMYSSRKEQLALRATAMMDVTPFDTETVLGNRLSAPSHEDGVAAFTEMMFVDAVTGCYRVVFYIANAGTVEDVTNAVFSQPSDIVCVDVKMKVAFKTGLPTRVGLGERLSQANTYPTLTLSSTEKNNRVVNPPEWEVEEIEEMANQGLCQQRYKDRKNRNYMIFKSGDSKYVNDYTFTGAMAMIVKSVAKSSARLPVTLKSRVGATANMFEGYSIMSRAGEYGLSTGWGCALTVTTSETMITTNTASRT